MRLLHCHAVTVRFVGRTRELEALANAYAAPQSSFIPVYGRRRVGKSELILRATRNLPTVYFVGKAAPAGLQLREFLRVAARSLDVPLLAEVQTLEWQRALQLVMENAPPGRKLVIALDEFQWTAQASPELPSVLQGLWDQQWRRGGRVMLVLCGSFVGFMEREVLGKSSPLFGRRTAQIRLQPLTHVEAAEFHESWSLADRARAYFICGGIPWYLELFDQSLSVQQNIERVVLAEHAPLFNEPDFLLREELREVDNYYAVLFSLAAGSATHGDIAKVTGISERSLSYYLKQLTELGYIERRYPLTSRRPNPRSVRYVLSDPLLRFWFRFLFPNLSFVQQQGPSVAFRELVRPGLDSYFGSCFERLCRAALPMLYRRESVNVSYEVGEYWDREVQIDVVGLRADAIDIGECKWGGYGGRARLEEELGAKAAAYPNPKNHTIFRRAFVRQRARSKAADGMIKWHDLEDIYAV